MSYSYAKKYTRNVVQTITKTKEMLTVENVNLRGSNSKPIDHKYEQKIPTID
jgi:hypothetical protein